MIMIKKIAALLAAITALPAMAQYDGYEPRGQFADEHNVYYGLRLGLGISTVNSDEKELDGGGAKTGLNIGAVISSRDCSTPRRAARGTLTARSMNSA